MKRTFPVWVTLCALVSCGRDGASRPIAATEVEACRNSRVRYVELPIALDGIVVAVHPDNDWAQSITVAELKRLWEPAAERKVTRWSQIRDDWPDQAIHLYGAGTDSGTYDYLVTEFVRYFVNEASKSVNAAGYVALPDSSYELVLSRFEHRVLGSLFHGADRRSG